MANYTGTSGDDTEVGTSGADVFHMEQGGDDTIKAGGGHDLIYFGASFTAADRVDGGAGSSNSALFLDGDYSSGLVFGANTIRNIDSLELIGGHSYKLTLNDSNVAPGANFVIEGSLGAGDSLWLDARKEKDGFVEAIPGAGNDTILGTLNANNFRLENGGHDVARGQDANDTFRMGATLDSGDRLDGGGGFDYVNLNGDYSAGVKLANATLSHIEEIDLTPGHDYKLTTADGNVAFTEQMVIYGSNLGATDSLNFNGAKETDGYFVIYGGLGSDKLTGGASNDGLHGSWGADVLTGGAGSDTFYFETLSDSTAAAPDRITDLTDSDAINLQSIDANSNTPGDDAFTLVSQFTSVAGQAMLHYAAGSNTTTLSLDVDGDGVADDKILMTGDHSGFTNFVL